MFVRFLVLAVICVLTSSVVLAQEAPPISAKSLLAELGELLIQTPTEPEECKALVERLKDWHKAKADELAKAKENQLITITSHKDQQKVPLRPIIRGKVFSNEANVWVIVHPTETAAYWVQPKATVKSTGEWYSQIFIGREGSIDSGKHFDIRVVANPKKPLARGDVLDGWPEAEARSEIVELIRE